MFRVSYSKGEKKALWPRQGYVRQRQRILVSFTTVIHKNKERKLVENKKNPVKSSTLPGK